jgi:hypothetical protein
MLAARSLGLDCGPMSGFDNAKVDEQFFARANHTLGCVQEFFPEGHVKSNFICNLGYGDPATLYPRRPRLSFSDDFKITNKPPAAAGSLEWFLARAGPPRFFLDLRAASRTPAIDAWLRTSRDSYWGTWRFADPASLSDTTKVRDWYDGILFVNESTPTHPTANARKTVERKESF